MNSHASRILNQSPLRRGATLVEVLMALLIMAVGVTSVFTLFPLSILKAVRANQLTNAKLYEGAIKDTLLTHPQLWTGAPEWRENTTYGRLVNTAPVQDRWVTPKPDGRMLPDTNQLFFCAANNPQTSGAHEPGFGFSRSWNAPLGTGAGGYNNSGPLPAGLGTSDDAGLTWTPYRHSAYLANPSWSAYVVDPLGWYRAATAAEQTHFGMISSGDSSSALSLDRIHCQISSGAASGIFQLQDSWNVVLESTPVTVTSPSGTQITIEFPTTLADTVDSNTLTSLHRVSMLSTLTSRVVSLPVTGASNPSPGFLTINGSLPTGFTPDQARMEIQAPSRYSWLMSVHSGPRGEFNAQCAIVFNRSFEVLDEQGYRAEFCQTEDVNGNGTIDTGEDTMFPNGRIDTNVAKIRWPYNADTDPPRIKEGGFIFDATFGHWYRIQKIEKINDEEQQRVDASDNLLSTGTYVRMILTLGDEVKVSSSNVTGGSTAYFTDYGVYDPNTTTQYDCQAVAMPGVVHVFTPEPPQ